MVATSLAKSLGQDARQLSINRSTIRRQRHLHRQNFSMLLKQSFSADVPLIIHWDGKLMPDLMQTSGHVERLPIIVTGNGVSQLLQVAKLPNSTGTEQSKAVVSTLNEWGLTERVVGMSFDTTASNTGRKAGACVLIEQQIGRNLLYLACRHHIHEIVAGAAFHSVFGTSEGPEVRLFKRFQGNWSQVDCSLFSTGIDDEQVAMQINDIAQDILNWAAKVLKDRKDLRDDYREFIELSIIFLGGVPPRGIHFLAPGPMHHARWMSKVIYSLKIWLFRKQFQLTGREEKGLRSMCIFAIRIYLKHWTESSAAIHAPRMDLQLLKCLKEYENIDDVISKATLAKFSNHLWYLSEELAGFALFDPSVSIDMKIMMVKAMKVRSKVHDSQKRATVPVNRIDTSQLSDFVSVRTLEVFEKLGIKSDFLQLNPATWVDNLDYKQAQRVIKTLNVTNDVAERGVSLIQEYCGKITRDEDQMQYLLQVVQAHRRQYPDTKKETLLGQQ